MARIYSSAIILLTILLSATSCEKVINVDLNDTDSKVVIDANISDNTGPYSVFLSRTVNFSQDNNMPPVTGATVIIVDSTANMTDTLSEVAPGHYQTHTISGIIGHTYNLSVFADNTWFRSSSTIQPLVPLDSLYLQTISFFGIEVKQCIPVFKDPVGVPNYYRFLVQVNDSLMNDMNAWDDRFSDGKVNSRPLNSLDDELLTGDEDTVIVEMRCIDKPSYDYFRTIENATGDASTPANPISNISGNALGYFSAYTSRYRSLIIKK